MNINKINNIGVKLDTFKADLSNIVNRLCIGPQSNIVESLEHFNDRYRTNIGVTRKFCFKPGTYDAIKKLYSDHVLLWNKKSKSVLNMFDKQSKYAWRGRNLQSDITNIEENLIRLRHRGIIWQDNADDFKAEFDRTKNKIFNDVKLALKHYPTLSCDIYVSAITSNMDNNNPYTSQYVRLDSFKNVFDNLSDLRDIQVIFLLKFDGGTMEYKEQLTNSKEPDLYKIEIPGTMYVGVSMKLFKCISNCWDKDYDKCRGLSRSSEYRYKITDPIDLKAAYISDYGSHPYIQHSICPTGFNLYDSNVNINHNICTGNMKSDMTSAFYNMNIYLGITHIYNWLHTYYTPQTNPLNKIYKLYSYGKPKAFAKIDVGIIEADVRNRSVGSCGYTATLDRNAYNFSKGTFGENNTYGSILSHKVDKYAEYIDSFDIYEAPCLDCSLVDKCSKFESLSFITKNKYTPEEEAILCNIMEYISILKQYVTNTRYYNGNHRATRLVFVEELVGEIENIYKTNGMALHDLFYWRDMEYLMYLSRQYNDDYHAAFERNSKILSYIHLLDPECIQWSIDGKQYNTHVLADARYIMDNERIHSKKKDQIDKIKATKKVVKSSIITPEEDTLRWASQFGSAHDL